MQIRVRHEPAFVAENVPRYDEDEMTLHFPSLRNLLRVFRHLTVAHVRRLMVKEKVRRKRRRSAERLSFAARAMDLVQVIGECVSQGKLFAFTVGSVFQPGLETETEFRYPVLLRSCEHWNNRDRMFEDELSLLWKTPRDLQDIRDAAEQDKAGSAEQETRRRSRKRIKESFLGFKWVKNVEKGPIRSLFHSFDPSDIHGELHFCAPSTVFVGSLYAPDVLRLCSQEPGLIDLD